MRHFYILQVGHFLTSHKQLRLRFRGLLPAYSGYVAARFGFGHVAATLLRAWAEPYNAAAQLPGDVPVSKVW